MKKVKMNKPNIMKDIPKGSDMLPCKTMSNDYKAMYELITGAENFNKYDIFTEKQVLKVLQDKISNYIDKLDIVLEDKT